jgi:hypothetical protein
MRGRCFVILRSQLNYSIVSSPYKRCTEGAKSVRGTYSDDRVCEIVTIRSYSQNAVRRSRPETFSAIKQPDVRGYIRYHKNAS